MQHIYLIGNLTADPVARATTSGATVCTFTIAVNRRREKDTTDFFRINAWRQLGENCKQYLAKGRKVAVIGELQPRLYDDKNGIKRMSLDVQADEVEFLSRPQQQNDEADPDNWPDLTDEDNPFKED